MQTQTSYDFTPHLLHSYASNASRNTGKERDTESGLDYFGARYLSSSIGRWMSPDPGWFMFADIVNPQSLNLYNYALNNPLVFVDIDGLELVRVVTANGQSVVVDRNIADDVISLVRAANNAGLRVTITSGFRSIQHQTDLYNAWLANGKGGNPVARPGHSGHNAGQSIDNYSSRMSAAQLGLLGTLSAQKNLPYAGAFDTVHFGAGFPGGNSVDPNLIAENNANPYPESTIVDGGTTTVDVTGTFTTVDLDTSNMIPDELIPIIPPPAPPTPEPDHN